MKRLLVTLLCAGLIGSTAGCAMCYTPFDETYAAYGGIRERQDRVHGRVGSVLSDPAMQFSEPGGMDESATEADLYAGSLDEVPVHE